MKKALKKAISVRKKMENTLSGVCLGKVHFPDVLNKEAREWFGNKYQVLLDQGIEGFWNDMNEPSIFFAQDRMDETFDKIAELKDKNLDIGYIPAVYRSGWKSGKQYR